MICLKDRVSSLIVPVFFLEANTLLSSVKSPEDIKNYSPKQLKELAGEIRRTIIDVVGKNGGHLASNLGVVELTIALHRAFNSPEDAIIWDVSHQCYAHKLLTGRYDQFSSLRTHNGLSGFSKKEESEHDFFDNGHSSTSISSALGLLVSKDIKGEKGKVIAVIGDGALTGGMALEGLSNAGQIGKNLIVIVNDNQMSIDHNTGAISSYLSRITMTSPYQSFRHNVDRFIQKIPGINRILTKFVFRFKRGLKGLLLSNNLFTDLGFEYVGPLDGHNIKEMETVFSRVKNMKRPVVVHVMTKKGKGYSPAEDHPEQFHGIGPFAISDGEVEKFDTVSFTESFSNSLMKLSEKRDDIVAITAAMTKGTGLDAFARHYPDRFFDVGIAEEHAVTFAGGLSRGGLLPVVCIYSTFMQRAVDQLIHDIALQNLNAIIVLDRAGAVPNDGETHQGLFDITLFRPVPNIQILSPATAQDLDNALNYSAECGQACVIRYPKMTAPTELSVFSKPYEQGRGVLVRAIDFEPAFAAQYDPDLAPDPSSVEKNVSRVLFVTTGGMFSEVLTASRALSFDNILADIYSLRFIKPFDEDYFLEIAKKYDGIVFVEDGIEVGGISEALSGLCARNGLWKNVIKAFPSKFFRQGNRNQVLSEAGLTAEDIYKTAKELIQND